MDQADQSSSAAQTPPMAQHPFPHPHDHPPHHQAGVHQPVVPHWQPRAARPPLRSTRLPLLMSAVSCAGYILAWAATVVTFFGLMTGGWGDDSWRHSTDEDGFALIMLAPGALLTALMVLLLGGAIVLYAVIARGLARERPWARVLGFVMAGLGLIGALQVMSYLPLPTLVPIMVLIPHPQALLLGGVALLGSLLWLGHLITTIWWIVVAGRATPGGRPAEVSPAPPMATAPPMLVGAGAGAGAGPGVDLSAGPGSPELRHGGEQGRI